MKYLAILLVLFFQHSFAVTGPEVSCPDCENLTERPLPRTGTWYNPEQSGTGMTIDVQVDKVFGVYYGYAEDGSQIWANFSGDLEASEEVGKLWNLTAEMIQFTDGTCINCEYSGRPTGRNIIGEIDLTFNQIGHASFSIDNGSVQNMVPFYFGVPAKKLFPEATSFSTPEIEGWWKIHLQYKGGQEFFERRTVTMYFAKILPHPSDEIEYGSTGFNWISYTESLTSSFDCFYNNVELREDPQCEFRTNIFGLDLPAFKIPIANITANKIFGENDDGAYIEFTRMHYNKCGFLNEGKEFCVNTMPYPPQ